MGLFKKAAQGLRSTGLGQAGLLAEFESVLAINNQITADSNSTLLCKSTGGSGLNFSGPKRASSDQ